MIESYIKLAPLVQEITRRAAQHREPTGELP